MKAFLQSAPTGVLLLAVYFAAAEGGAATFDLRSPADGATVYGATARLQWQWSGTPQDTYLRFQHADGDVAKVYDSSSLPRLSFSVMVWAMADLWPGYMMTIVGKGFDGGEQYVIDYDHVTKKIRFFSKNSDGTGAGVSVDPPSAGAWHHYAVTWDNGTLRAYIDGTEVGNAPKTSIIAKDTSFLGIGARMVKANLFKDSFQGGIKDLRVYNRAVSQGDIRSVYRGLEISRQGLAGAWKLNEGEGRILFDSALGIADGELGNADSSVESSDPVWAAMAESGVKSYEIFVDNNKVGTTSGGTVFCNCSGLSIGQHTWYVVSIDGGKNATQSVTRRLTVTGWPSWAIGPWMKSASNPVLAPSEIVGDWDQGRMWGGVHNCGVVVKDGTFYLIYRGERAIDWGEKYICKVGMAWSTDGVYFTKYDRNPLWGADDKYSYEDVNLVEYRGTYYAYCNRWDWNNASDFTQNGVFLATSTDLKKWTPYGLVFTNATMMHRNAAVLCNPHNQAVKAANGKFVMYMDYDTIAYSDDLVHWSSRKFAGYPGGEVCFALADYDDTDSILMFTGGGDDKAPWEGKHVYAIGAKCFYRKATRKKFRPACVGRR